MKLVQIVLPLVLAVCASTWAQQRASPFSPPDSGAKPGVYPQASRIDNVKVAPVRLLKSPFSPPTAPEMRKDPVPRPVIAPKTTERVTTGAPVNEPVWQENRPRLQPTPEAQSPFSPPFRSEWREQDQADIHSDVNEINNRLAKPARGGRRGRRRNRPAPAVYQGEGNRKDMHDVEPGVTPWTRYTNSPRRPQDSRPQRRPPAGGVSARCRNVSYSPRKDICCQGVLDKRRGVKPACCGTVAYDMAFNKCCEGVVSFRSANEPNC